MSDDRNENDSEPIPAIGVRGLSKRFNSQTVLSNVCFEISGNEMLVVLGPSGSGKTTLLRIIAGLEQADEGDVYLKATRATDFPPQRRKLGVVFQEQALFQRMTVRENIAYGLKLRRASEANIRSGVDEMLELTRLQAHKEKLPSQLSGGQRQRVAVARALVFKPDALLFDEPFSSLDAVTRTELRREVRLIQRALNIPALFITHDQEEALELADRILVLNNGSIEQLDTPFEIYNHPQNEFVATFLGAANVLLGRWQTNRVSIGGLNLKLPEDAPSFIHNQAVKIVFRPEDVVLNFQPQYLDTPIFLNYGVVEEVSYVGHTERLVVRLAFNRRASNSMNVVIDKPNLALVDDNFDNDFSVIVTRTKWEAAELNLSAGDTVAVGLKDYRLLAHYPLGSETGAKVLGK